MMIKWWERCFLYNIKDNLIGEFGNIEGYEMQPESMCKWTRTTQAFPILTPLYLYFFTAQCTSLIKKELTKRKPSFLLVFPNRLTKDHHKVIWLLLKPSRVQVVTHVSRCQQLQKVDRLQRVHIGKRAGPGGRHHRGQIRGMACIC